MASRMFFFRTSGAISGGGGGLGPGYYYAATTSATPPDPTNAGAWTATTHFNDIGLNDHTTFESHIGDAGSCYLHMLYIPASPATVSFITYAVNTVGNGSAAPASWNGSAWAGFGTTRTWTHLIATWEDLDAGDFTAITNVSYCVLTLRDQGAVPIASGGDYRIT